MHMGNGQSSRLDALEARLSAVENESGKGGQQFVIEQYKREIETLKAVNKDLSEKLLRVIRNHSGKEETTEKEVSMENIQTYVDELLTNPSTNIPYLPDYVERKIYTNVFEKLYQLLDKILNNMRINLPAGHEIVVRLDAKKE